LDGSAAEGKRLDAYIDHLSEKLITGRATEESFTTTSRGNRGDFYSPRGWWFHPSYDWGSLEIQAQPMTVAEILENKEDIQTAVFDSAWEVKLMAALYRGGGHINMSAGPFEHDHLFFRNFIVDMLNHNELWYGIFNYDPSNGTPFELLHETTQEQVLSNIRRVDTALKHNISIHLEQFRHNVAPLLSGKHVFLNLIGLNMVGSFRDRKIEIRAVRPQLSADVYYRQVKLLNARLLHIYKMSQSGEVIPHQPRLQLTKNFRVQVSGEVEGLFRPDHEPPVDVQKALQAFYEFVNESGEQWSDHRDYMWPKWRNAGGELEKFENSEWFIKREQNKCRELIQ
jgi:hypothetical protein